MVVNYEEGSENSILDGDPRWEPVGESPSPVVAGERDLANESFFEHGSRPLTIFSTPDLAQKHLPFSASSSKMA